MLFRVQSRYPITYVELRDVYGEGFGGKKEKFVLDFDGSWKIDAKDTNIQDENYKSDVD